MYYYYLCASEVLHWRTNTVSSPVSRHCSAVHILLAVSCSLSDVSMVSSLSLSPSLCRSCAARSPLWPDDSIQICVLFRRGLRVVRSLLHAAWDKPLSGERKRQRAHHSVRNILRLSGQQAQTQQVVARVSVSSLLLITHWLDWYWGWWDGCQHNVLIYMFQSLKMWQMWVDSYTKTEQIFF